MHNLLHSLSCVPSLNDEYCGSQCDNGYWHPQHGPFSDIYNFQRREESSFQVVSVDLVQDGFLNMTNNNWMVRICVTGSKGVVDVLELCVPHLPRSTGKPCIPWCAPMHQSHQPVSLQRSLGFVCWTNQGNVHAQQTLFYLEKWEIGTGTYLARNVRPLFCSQVEKYIQKCSIFRVLSTKQSLCN